MADEEQVAEVQGRPNAPKRKPVSNDPTKPKAGCNGWNYHVWQMLGNRCVMCGERR